MNGTNMIQITETQAMIFRKLIEDRIQSKRVTPELSLELFLLKTLLNEIDGKIAESELEQEKRNEVEK